MLFRVVMLAGGFAAAVTFSQFPEYSQQYTQRLAGAVDELSGIVEMFDSDAAALNMSREEALIDLAGGGAMASARAISMQHVFDRHERLSNDLNVLRSDAVVKKAVNIWRMTDLDVAQKAWADFRPAVPLALDGIGFGVAGFLAGLGLVGGARAAFAALFRQRRYSS